MNTTTMLYRYGPLFAAIATTAAGEVAEVVIQFPLELSGLLAVALDMSKSQKYAHVVVHMGELHDGVGDLTIWKDGEYTEEVRKVLEVFENPDPVFNLPQFLIALATASILNGQWYEVHGDFHTTALFWDCECMGGCFVHPFTETRCDTCGAERDESPDSRIEEILARWQKAGLPPALLQIIKNAGFTE